MSCFLSIPFLLCTPWLFDLLDLLLVGSWFVEGKSETCRVGRARRARRRWGRLHRPSPQGSRPPCAPGRRVTYGRPAPCWTGDATPSPSARGMSASCSARATYTRSESVSLGGTAVLRMRCAGTSSPARCLGVQRCTKPARRDQVVPGVSWCLQVLLGLGHWSRAGAGRVLCGWRFSSGLVELVELARLVRGGAWLVGWQLAIWLVVVGLILVGWRAWWLVWLLD